MTSPDMADFPTGTEGRDATERAGAFARFVVAMGFFVAGLVLIGTGASMQDTGGALWFVGGILAVTIGFALPLGPHER